jgi:hypothetical protein
LKHDKNRTSVDVRSKGVEQETGRRENDSAPGHSETLAAQGIALKYRCITSPVLFF